MWSNRPSPNVPQPSQSWHRCIGRSRRHLRGEGSRERVPAVPRERDAGGGTAKQKTVQGRHEVYQPFAERRHPRATLQKRYV